MDCLSYFEPKEEQKNNKVVDQYQTKMEFALDKMAAYVADNTTSDGLTLRATALEYTPAI